MLTSRMSRRPNGGGVPVSLKLANYMLKNKEVPQGFILMCYGYGDEPRTWTEVTPDDYPLTRPFYELWPIK